MAKFKEGLPLSLTMATLVNYKKEVSDSGDPYVELYFLSVQSLPSVGIKLEPKDILKKFEGKKSEDKPYNLKFKIYQDKQELTVGLNVGQTYWIEYSTGQNSFGDGDGKHRTYLASSIFEIKESLPDYWKELYRQSQPQNKAA